MEQPVSSIFVPASLRLCIRCLRYYRVCEDCFLGFDFCGLFVLSVWGECNVVCFCLVRAG